MPFIAPLMAALGTMVATSLGFWIFSALGGLGIALAVQEFALDPALDSIQSAAAGMGANALAWFRYFGGDKFITIVCSAYGMASLAGVIRMRKKAT